MQLDCSRPDFMGNFYLDFVRIDKNRADGSGPGEEKPEPGSAGFGLSLSKAPGLACRSRGGCGGLGVKKRAGGTF